MDFEKFQSNYSLTLRSINDRAKARDRLNLCYSGAMLERSPAMPVPES